MAKNVSLLGANYPNVPAVQLPQTGGGTATFIDGDDLQEQIGNLANLQTTAKTNLVAAVNEAMTKATIQSWVFLDSDSTHYASVAAYGYYDAILNIYTLSGGVTNPSKLTGYTVLCDRNANLLVSIVSQSGNTLTFRWHNPTNTAQTIQGIVGIFRYL